MADNFNLRQFLSENKLTKNTRLLSENTDISQKFSDAGITGEVTVLTIPSLGQEPKFEVMDAQDALEMIQSAAEGDKKVITYSGDEISRQGEYNKETKGLEGKLGVGIFSKSDNVANVAYEIYQAPKKEETTVKENTMTQREKYLTRLVENALGLEGISEDEMAQETVIPEYKSIEELMKNIQDGTNKVAEEHKISEMKKIAEALRKKKNTLEESEHAQYMNKADLKRLDKDIKDIEKAVAKAVATFDKKFNKKEKTSAAKAEKVEALQEGTFDLKKFLVENKLTANSRMLSENFNDQTLAIRKFINKPLLGGYFINTVEGPMHSIDLQIATEPDNHEGKKLTDFKILGTARYYPNDRWELRDGPQPIEPGKMPKLASKTPADDELLATIAAEINGATPAAQ